MTNARWLRFEASSVPLGPADGPVELGDLKRRTEVFFFRGFGFENFSLRIGRLLFWRWCFAHFLRGGNWKWWQVPWNWKWVTGERWRFLPHLGWWSLVSFGNWQIGNGHFRKLPSLNHIPFFGVFSWVVDLQCYAWVMWPRGVWPPSCDSWISYCHFLVWFSMVLEQTIQQMAAVTWCFFLLGSVGQSQQLLCLMVCPSSNIHMKDVDVNVESLLDASWCTSQLPTSNMIVRQFRNWSSYNIST